MRNIIAAICIFVCASAPGFAATPSTESLDEMFELTHVSALMRSMTANIEQNLRQSMQQSLGTQELTDTQQRANDAMAKKFADAMREELTWDKLRPIYINIYQESLTQEEVDGLIAFYRSPAGDAMVKKLPLIAQKTMGAVQTMMGPLVARLKVAQAEAMAESKAAQ